MKDLRMNKADIMLIVDALIEQGNKCTSITTANMVLELIEKVKALPTITPANLPTMEALFSELDKLTNKQF